MKYYGIQNEVKAYINRLNRDNISVITDDLKTINDRVILLKKSGVWSKFSLGFNDIDADAYCTRAGVTNLLGRCEVIWFAKGVKALGLWNSMVSWPMRNYQNASTGLTVYSLGGFGIHNGTMVGGPVWNTNGSGIRFTAPTVRQYVNIPTLTQSFHTDSASIFAASANSYLYVVPRLIGAINNPLSELTVWVSSTNKITGLNTWSGSIGNTASISPNLDFLTYNNFGVSFNYGISSVDYLVNNKITTQSRAPTVITAAMQIAAGQSANDHWNGDIAYGIKFYTNLTATQMLAMKNLATNTLGFGLNLP